jgi:glucose-6-phosphate 1-epimerase
MNLKISHLRHQAVGAQLLEANISSPSGEFPLFYNSPISKPNFPARGGVPILFPQFSDTGPLPKHGWARNMPWVQINEKFKSTSDVSFQLHMGAQDRADWPFACDLRLQVTSTERGIRISLSVHNTGELSFHWTGGLHPYWCVDDLLINSLSGLSGIQARDRYDASFVRQVGAELTWTDQPFERLYTSCPPVQLHTSTHSLELTAGGFTEWMVWNPGASGAQLIDDLPDEDWQKFVCIEPVCVTSPVVMEPGQLFEGWLQAELLHPF